VAQITKVVKQESIRMFEGYMRYGKMIGGGTVYCPDGSIHKFKIIDIKVH
jgi:hypothetical protein